MFFWWYRYDFVFFTGFGMNKEAPEQGGAWRFSPQAPRKSIEFSVFFQFSNFTFLLIC
jgi:hypothetical protein